MMPETQEWINKAEGDWKVAGREGVLSASTDNTIAGKMGGIELELRQVSAVGYG